MWVWNLVLNSVNFQKGSPKIHFGGISNGDQGHSRRLLARFLYQVTLVNLIGSSDLYLYLMISLDNAISGINESLDISNQSMNLEPVFIPLTQECILKLLFDFPHQNRKGVEGRNQSLGRWICYSFIRALNA